MLQNLADGVDIVDQHFFSRLMQTLNVLLVFITRR